MTEFDPAKPKSRADASAERSSANTAGYEDRPDFYPPEPETVGRKLWLIPVAVLFGAGLCLLLKPSAPPAAIAPLPVEAPVTAPAPRALEAPTLAELPPVAANPSAPDRKGNPACETEEALRSPACKSVCPPGTTARASTFNTPCGSHGLRYTCWRPKAEGNIEIPHSRGTTRMADASFLGKGPYYYQCGYNTENVLEDIMSPSD